MPRLTIRWMVLVVAVVGLACGMLVRSARHRDKALRYTLSDYVVVQGYYPERTPSLERRVGQLSAHYSVLAAKYERLARYPWLPVPPDPPEPN